MSPPLGQLERDGNQTRNLWFARLITLGLITRFGNDFNDLTMLQEKALKSQDEQLKQKSETDKHKTEEKRLE